MSELQRAIEQQVSQVLAHHRAEDIAACVRDAASSVLAALGFPPM